MEDNIDILMLSESKLDSSFPSALFEIEGCIPPFRFGRNGHGSGVIIFIRGNMLARMIRNVFKQV